MRITEAERLDEKYPPANKCEINSKSCDFDPISHICHECGTPMCEHCAVGVLHQPQLIEYEQNNEQKQAHCPDCAGGHDLRTTVVGGGAAAILLGLVIAVLIGQPAAIGVGLLILIAGAYFVRRELKLKKDRSMTGT